MLVKTLDGLEYQISMSECVTNHKRQHKSTLHIKTRKLLLDTFPTDFIYEEVGIPMNSDKTLYVDFYIPVRRIAVEVQGSQHYKFTSFFHKSKIEFLKAQENDRLKKQFCDINDITLVTLKYNEESLWQEQLKNC